MIPFSVEWACRLRSYDAFGRAPLSPLSALSPNPLLVFVSPSLLSPSLLSAQLSPSPPPCPINSFFLTSFKTPFLNRFASVLSRATPRPTATRGPRTVTPVKGTRCYVSLMTRATPRGPFLGEALIGCLQRRVHKVVSSGNRLFRGLCMNIGSVLNRLCMRCSLPTVGTVNRLYVCNGAAV